MRVSALPTNRLRGLGQSAADAVSSLDDAQTAVDNAGDLASAAGLDPSITDALSQVSSVIGSASDAAAQVAYGPAPDTTTGAASGVGATGSSAALPLLLAAAGALALMAFL
jgi:hypothetical protein